MNDNSCLLIVVLAITIIFVCYYCNSKSSFNQYQPEAAKWASSLGLMGVGDSSSDINADMNKARQAGVYVPPPDMRPSYGPPGHYAPGNIDQEFAAIKLAMQKAYGIDPKVWGQHYLNGSS